MEIVQFQEAPAKGSGETIREILDFCTFMSKTELLPTHAEPFFFHFQNSVDDHMYIIYICVYCVYRQIYTWCLLWVTRCDEVWLMNQSRNETLVIWLVSQGRTWIPSVCLCWPRRSKFLFSIRVHPWVSTLEIWISPKMRDAPMSSLLNKANDEKLLGIWGFPSFSGKTIVSGGGRHAECLQDCGAARVRVWSTAFWDDPSSSPFYGNDDKSVDGGCGFPLFQTQHDTSWHDHFEVDNVHPSLSIIDQGCTITWRVL